MHSGSSSADSIHSADAPHSESPGATVRLFCHAGECAVRGNAACGDTKTENIGGDCGYECTSLYMYRS